MKFWGISVSISATIKDIWTKFGTELKDLTANMPECAKMTKVKNPT